MIRKPAAAGLFYPGDEKELNSMIDGFLADALKKFPKKKYRGIVAPHAGYVYSGRTQAYSYTASVPGRAVVLGVNHRGLGAPTSVFGDGRWLVPNGSLECDAEMSSFLMSEAPRLSEDPSAHEGEHSIEVQLPFLARKNPAVRITPISMYDYSVATCRELGAALSRALEKFPETIIVASSDFTHYEEYSDAERQDALAAERILAVDPEGLASTVRENGISMCGLGPVAALLFALKAASAKRLYYETSAAATGDYSSVVGYASFVFE